jgi:hypothetical protein
MGLAGHVPPHGFRQSVTHASRHEAEAQFHVSLISALDAGAWKAAHNGRCTISSKCVRGWMDLKSALNTEDENNLYLCQELNPHLPQSNHYNDGTTQLHCI